MKKIRCELTTQAPVLISANAGSTFAMETLTAIPGRTLLGAFAAMFINCNALGSDAHLDPIFSSWFLKGGLKFSQAAPLIIRDKGQPVAGKKIPLCIRITKENNTLINTFETCCQEKSGTLNKFCIKVSGSRQDTFLLKADDTRTRIQLHHARDRQKGSAMEGDFFAYESICAGEKFAFDIRGEEKDLLSFIRKFSISSPDGIKISLGKSRTAEYGTCRVHLLTPSPEDISLNPELEKAISDQKPIIGVLNSPAIILDEYGLPSLKTSDLEKALHLKIDQQFAVFKQIINEKFSAVWGLKTPSELAFDSGTCFRINTGSTDLSTLKKQILDLETHGLGEKTHEGFGSISFIPLDKYKDTTGLASNEIHPRTNVAKPDVTVPDTVKKMVTDILTTQMTDRVKSSALSDVTAFFQGPKNDVCISSSLCSGLENLAMNGALEKQLKLFQNDQEKTKAAMSLKAFYNNESNLLTHLSKKAESLDNLDRHVECLSKHFRSCGLEIETIDMERLATFIRKKKLLQTYMTTFFSAMRKRIISNKEAQ